MASQITSVSIIYSIVCSGADQTPELRVTGFCVGNSLVTGEFPAQRDSNTEIIFIDDVIVSLLFCVFCCGLVAASLPISFRINSMTPACDAEIVSMSWRHHAFNDNDMLCVITLWSINYDEYYNTTCIYLSDTTWIPYVLTVFLCQVHQVLDLEIGKNAVDISLDLRSKCPYIEATIMEIQRFSSIFPIAVMHTVTTDIKFRGYHVPKATEVSRGI